MGARGLGDGGESRRDPPVGKGGTHRWREEVVEAGREGGRRGARRGARGEVARDGLAGPCARVTVSEVVLVANRINMWAAREARERAFLLGIYFMPLNEPLSRDPCGLYVRSVSCNLGLPTVGDKGSARSRATYLPTLPHIPSKIGYYFLFWRAPGGLRPPTYLPTPRSLCRPQLVTLKKNQTQGTKRTMTAR